MKITPAELHQHSIAVETDNSWKFSTNIKHIVIYPAILVAMSLSVNYFFISNILPIAPSANIIYAGVFLFIGLLHIFIFPRWLRNLMTPGLKFIIVYTVGLALLVSITSLLLFPIDIKQLQVIAITTGSAFLLPFAIYACVYYFRSIGTSQYQPWVIPADAVPDARKSLMLNSIGFKIKINVKESDITPTLFTIHLQAGLKLSVVFIRFLYDHNDTVEAVDSNDNSYGWLFYTWSRWGKKMLDPDLTLSENEIRRGTVIVVERIIPSLI